MGLARREWTSAEPEPEPALLDDWATEILRRVLSDGSTIHRGADDAAIGLHCWSLAVGDATLYADVTDAEAREVGTERLPLLIVERWGADASLYPELHHQLQGARDLLGAEADRRQLARRRAALKACGVGYRGDRA